ncbi:hypothetical protein BV898_05753 [Hypsibius exemplaris]|uniref:DUF4378 domain-containing protein n=1 Tax=Hypsibius exemplaris TaxID=2072580 RepID=A0A1W0WYC5_HYPEX|nr:hypothetical protein BV898_05753 [Hypsibius exemplaris]
MDRKKKGQRFPSRNSRSSPPRDALPSSAAAAHSLGIIQPACTDTVGSLATKERLLLEELQRLQEKKKWLLGVLHNVDSNDSYRLKLPMPGVEKKVERRARPGTQAEGVVDTAKLGNGAADDASAGADENGEVKHRPETLEHQRSPRSKSSGKEPRERLRVLSESSHRLNNQLQAKLQDLALGQQSSEFSKKDPYNFINSYARKLGYLSARKDGRKPVPLKPRSELEVTERLELEITEPPVKKIVVQKVATAGEDTLTTSVPPAQEATAHPSPTEPDYENDFDTESSVAVSPAVAVAAGSDVKEEKKETGSLLLNESLRIPSLVFDAVPQTQATTSNLPEHRRSEIGPRPVSPSDVRLQTPPSIRNALVDRMVSPKLIRLTDLGNSDATVNHQNISAASGLSARFAGTSPSIVPLSIPVTPRVNTETEAPELPDTPRYRPRSASDVSEAGEYSLNFTPLSGRSEDGNLRKETLFVDEPETLLEPNQSEQFEPVNLLSVLASGAVPNVLAVRSPLLASVEVLPIPRPDSSQNSVPMELSDNEADEDRLKTPMSDPSGSQNLKAASQPQSTGQVRQDGRPPSSSTLSTVSDAFLSSESEDEVSDGRVKARDIVVSSSGRLSPDVARESPGGHPISSSELSSVRSDFLSSHSADGSLKADELPTGIQSSGPARNLDNESPLLTPRTLPDVEVAVELSESLSSVPSLVSSDDTRVQALAGKESVIGKEKQLQEVEEAPILDIQDLLPQSNADDVFRDRSVGEDQVNDTSKDFVEGISSRERSTRSPLQGDSRPSSSHDSDSVPVELSEESPSPPALKTASPLVQSPEPAVPVAEEYSEFDTNNDAELSRLESVSSLTPLSVGDADVLPAMPNPATSLDLPGSLGEAKSNLLDVAFQTAPLVALTGDFVPASFHAVAHHDTVNLSLLKEVGEEKLIPFEADIHYPDSPRASSVIPSTDAAAVDAHGDQILSARSASPLSSVSEDIPSSTESDSMFVQRTIELLKAANSGQASSALPTPTTSHALAGPSSTYNALPKPIGAASLPVEDWMDDDFFAGILPPPATSDSLEDVTEFREAVVPRRPAEVVRKEKLDKFLPLVDAMAHHVFELIRGGTFSSFLEIPFSSLPKGIEHSLVGGSEFRLIFDTILDVCDQTYTFPSDSAAASATSLNSRKLFPKNASQFVTAMSQQVASNTARMVLPDTAASSITLVASPTGSGDQDEVEQQAVYKLAFRDLELMEDEWCNFKEGESLLKEESVNVIWDDLVDEVVLDIQKSEAKRKQSRSKLV